MPLPDLNAMLRAPEGALLERKPETVNTREIRKTLVAFANSAPQDQYAVLFLGLQDDGTVSGVSNTDALQKRVREAAEQDAYPPIEYETRILSADNCTVLAIAVPHSKRRPHFAGPAFIRRGSESVVATETLYEQLIHSRTQKCGQILQWKNQIITVVTLQHVLGKIKLVSDVHHKEVFECRVLDCDSHTIRLEVINSAQRVAEPLENVAISRDEEKWRPMLIVRGAAR